MSRYWKRRLTRHAVLAALAGLVTVAALLWLAPARLIWRVSVTTGWLGALFLVATLMAGPVNVLRGRSNPISFDLRRDFGIWAALTATVHTAAGLFVHLRGHPGLYFFWDRPQAHLVPVRYDAFGLANWLGALGTAVILLLGLLSNDAAVRRLGARRWKAIQRLNYGIFVAVASHGMIYQVYLERRVPVWIGLLALLIVATVGVQVAGMLAAVRSRR